MFWRRGGGKRRGRGRGGEEEEREGGGGIERESNLFHTPLVLVFVCSNRDYSCLHHN